MAVYTSSTAVGMGRAVNTAFRSACLDLRIPMAGRGAQGAWRNQLQITRVQLSPGVKSASCKGPSEAKTIEGLFSLNVIRVFASLPSVPFDFILAS